ncbi:MAG: hypothetical protein KatS3mg100_199 [Candidatus Parcubacteria bacterium]|nr:MAG: hypothetical protein KatS3mg100_199 [Candidatus Parcubacteria bacterium]
MTQKRATPTASATSRAHRDVGKSPTIALLDIHAIIHRAFHALPQFTAPNGEPTGALFGLVSMLSALVKDVRPTHMVAAYDLPGGTHRHHAYAEYKAGRKEMDEALARQIEASKELLTALGIPVLAVPGFEADDIIATLVAQLREALPQAHIVVVSGDLDTLQLVAGAKVRVYTMRKGVRDTAWFDEAAVRERYGFAPRSLPEYKGLAGDPSDNIPGVPGVGDKSAKALIGAYRTIDAVLRAARREGAAAVAKRAGVSERMVRLIVEHTEDARFSRELAIARTDAPVRFSEEQSRFPSRVDEQKVESLMRRWAFRTPAARLREALSSVYGSDAAQGSERGNTRQHEDSTNDPNATNSCVDAAETDRRYRARLALWLLQPDHTNPSWEDVVAFTQTPDSRKALAALEDRLAEEELERVYRDIEIPLIPVLRAMEVRGIPVDAQLLAQASKELQQEAAREEARIHEFAGMEFNVRSTQQLGEVLFEKLGIGAAARKKKTATGKLSTRESALLQYADEHPIIQHILRYRELTKLVSTYLEPLQEMRSADGRIHPTFLQMGTATGRLASQNPNVQNLPATPEGMVIRRAIRPAEGFVLVALDYSQIELRIAAILAQEEKLIEAFARGEDIHQRVAAEVFRVASEEVTPEMRRRAKAINFGILYGMGVTALAVAGAMSRSEAAAFHEAYFATFPGIARYVQETKRFARQHGYTKTIFGRKRWFPGLRSPLPYVVAQAERMAINAPIQGSQADIIKIAMRRAHEEVLPRFVGEAFLILQVHDELVYEVKKERAALVAREVARCMREALPEEARAGVPLRVDVKMGDTFGEMIPFVVEGQEV